MGTFFDSCQQKLLNVKSRKLYGQHISCSRQQSHSGRQTSNINGGCKFEVNANQNREPLSSRSVLLGHDWPSKWRVYFQMLFLERVVSRPKATCASPLLTACREVWLLSFCHWFQETFASDARMPKCHPPACQRVGQPSSLDVFVHIGSQTTLDDIAQNISTIEQCLCQFWCDATPMNFNNNLQIIKCMLKEA